MTGIAASVVLSACYGGTWDDTGPIDTSNVVDNDGDGFASDVDCNDEDPAINPDALEVCDDTVDNDCDGLIDDADDECQPVG